MNPGDKFNYLDPQTKGWRGVELSSRPDRNGVAWVRDIFTGEYFTVFVAELRRIVPRSEWEAKA